MNYVSIKKLRELTPIKNYICGPFSVAICRYLSPLVSIPSIKNNVSPNTITLLMIIAGVFGGLLLLQPIILIKILCIPVYLLWFIFDCADGEIARFTNRFSKYGKQLDWMAHLACHPLYILGLWTTFFQYRNDHFLMITITTFVLLSIELINRLLVAINDLCFIKENNSFKSVVKSQSIIKYIKNQLFWFPNQVLLCPLLFVLDILLDKYFFFYVFMSWSSLYIIYVLKKYVIFAIRMYKS